MDFHLVSIFRKIAVLRTVYSSIVCTHFFLFMVRFASEINPFFVKVRTSAFLCGLGTTTKQPSSHHKLAVAI